MFNLLPEPEKKQILAEYNTRRIIMALIFLFILGCVAVISIFPAYLLSSSKVREVESGIGSIRQSDIFAEEELLRAELASANERLNALMPTDGEMQVNELLAHVIAHRSDTIRINGFSFSRSGPENEAILAVAGIAESRDMLSSFVDSLRGDALFGEVDLPVSNFAKDRNAEFTLEVQGTF
jgi:hypothetical protein